MGRFLDWLGGREARSGVWASTLLLSVACSAGSGDTTTGGGPAPIMGVKPGDMQDVDGDGQLDVAIDGDGDGDADGWDTNGDRMIDRDLFGNPIGGPEPMPCVGMYCDGSVPKTCGQSYDLSPNTTNVMFLVDGSNSMAPHWGTIRDAMVRIVNANPTLNFGVHMFYAGQANILGFFRNLNACGETMHPRLELLANNGQNIVNAMGQQPPGMGAAFFDTSPVLAALNWYLENDTPLNDPTSANFLVIVSDLVDTCFGTLFSNPESVNGAAGSEQLLAFEKLAVELRKRNVNVLPIGFAATSGGGGSGAQGDVNMQALEALTQLGATSVVEPLLAASMADIDKAIEAIGVAVQPCRFTIPAVQSENLNAFELSFLIDGQVVPRDRANTEGWNFVQGNTSEVQFFGDACRALQVGQKLSARTKCDDEPVCGIASTKLVSDARAMQILLDGSASMWGNPLDPLFNGQLTPWGQATKALANMVTNPINDDLELGFQFFPAGASGQCTIDAPEVPIGPSTEISIIEQMVGSVPTGSTPLVGVMQHVADNPGRLAEPKVEGSVLLVSDGGDSCGTEATRAQDLATAATTLFNRGIKTYAVRFGEAPNAAEDVQLTNIALNGGTGKYLLAPDGAALTKVLETISDGLFSCGLTLGELPDEVDPAQVNVFLNGVAVPRDDAGKKEEGWYWSGDTKAGDYSRLTFFGPHCELLKNSRLSDIVIEFGCKPLVVE